MTTNKSLSFSQAIQATQSLMNKIESQHLGEADIEQEVSAITKTKNGGRGFFVAYLTSDLALPDRPSEGIVKGLKSSEKVISELLVKNLAMSSAMSVTHNRNNDLKNVEGSQRVCRRTKNLIQQIKLNSVEQELNKLQETITQKSEAYNDFLERWGYDREQQEAIETAISDTLV
ncbi:MAG: hypothetical protein AAGE96_14150 [Cyanobacteria bacterium P01_G01_bin.19]